MSQVAVVIPAYNEADRVGATVAAAATLGSADVVVVVDDGSRDDTARVALEAGAIVLVSAISPYRAARDQARRNIGNFLEVWVHAPLEVCERRDIKGIYRRARAGELAHVTGIDDPYEHPLAPDVECRTDLETLEESVARVLAMVESRLARG